MADLRSKDLQDNSIRKAYRDALNHDRITENEVKKIIHSTRDGKKLLHREIEDLQRIHSESKKLTPRAKLLLGDFLARTTRLAAGRQELDLMPMVYGKRYDSRMVRPSRTSRIWHLYIDVRVELEAVSDEPETCTIRNADMPCVPWPRGEFEKFKRAVKQQSRFWSDRFNLQPPAGLTSLTANVHRDPFVLCRFNLMLVSPGVRRHRRIKAVYMDSEDGSEMRSKRSLWDNRDVEPTSRRRGGKTYKRVTVWHEIGHQLGLDHIGSIKKYRECVGPGSDSDARVCYGRHAQDRRDIMGIGTGVRKHHAGPWLEAVARHTFTKPADWKTLVNSSKNDEYSLP